MVVEAIDNIDLSTTGAPSLVLRDLSEHATLPFLAGFDVSNSLTRGGIPKDSHAPKQDRGSQKRVTYIGLSKKTMPQLVDLFLRFKDQATVYNDGTVEAIFSVRVSLV